MKRRLSVTLGADGTDMMTGLIRRDGRYSTRKVIPLDLQAHYGRREIVRALRTSDPATAKRAHLVMWQMLEMEFEDTRKELAGAPTQSVSEEAETPTPIADISPTLVSLVKIDSLREERDRAAKDGTLAAFMRNQRDTLAMTQAMLDGEVTATKDYRELEGIRNALRAFLTGDNSFAIAAARKARTVVDEAQAKPASVGKGDSLTSVVDRWAAENKPEARTVKRTQNIVDRFEAVNGKLAVQAVTKQHVLAFKDALIAQGQSPANINVMIPMLGTVFNYAADKLHLIQVNPAAKVRVTDKRRAKEKRRAFEIGEINAIFASPVYSEGRRPSAAGGEAAYWLPLLALYTGARQTELGQLHPDDVAEESYMDADGEEHSAWVIRIVENAERGQHVKNEGSERRVPIHADLIALGFVKVAQAAKAKGRARIFPMITPNSVGELMGNWSKWFMRYRRKECGLTSKETPFHSFRHSFKHFARLSHIPNDVHNEFTGHETGDVADAYGGLSYPLAPLVEGMKLYRVPGLKLPAPPPGLA